MNQSPECGGGCGANMIEEFSLGGYGIVECKNCFLVFCCDCAYAFGYNRCPNHNKVCCSFKGTIKKCVVCKNNL